MINKLKNIIIAVLGVYVLFGCEKGNVNPSTDPTPNPDDSLQVFGGYAEPGGIMILNQGARTSQNSSITYISPDGSIEENIYRNKNNTAFGNEAQDLYIYNGKIYLLSNGLFSPNDEEGDGVLVIANAETMEKEKAYKMSELKFKRPEGSKDTLEMLPLSTPFENIAVLDERNIFIEEDQGMFRFNSETGELNIIEGTFNFGNQGNTIEVVSSARGIIRVGDCLYCGGGGFWQTTRLLEISKDKNKVNRVLPDLNGDFISGICQTGEREIMLATCGRGGEKKSYLIFIDIDKWEIVKEKRISEDISAEFFNTPGITHAGDYIYFAAGSTKIRRLSLTTFKGEDYIDVAKDVPNAPYLNCNVIADKTTQYLYVAVSDEYYESVIPKNNYVLIYDCSGNSPKLIRTIHNKTSYPIGIFPVSKFYQK